MWVAPPKPCGWCPLRLVGRQAPLVAHRPHYGWRGGAWPAGNGYDSCSSNALGAPSPFAIYSRTGRVRKFFGVPSIPSRRCPIHPPKKSQRPFSFDTKHKKSPADGEGVLPLSYSRTSWFLSDGFASKKTVAKPPSKYSNVWKREAMGWGRDKKKWPTGHCGVFLCSETRD